MRFQTLVGRLLCCLLALTWTAAAAAKVKLPAVIGDNMMLQRGQPVPIWGWADKGEEITVSIAGQTLTTKAGDNGRWQVVLQKLDVGQPLEMSVKGSADDAITVKNILVGEVWLCSGQSNMQFTLNRAKDAKQEAATANYPEIRLFTVSQAGSPEPQSDCKGKWSVCSPASAERFSAVGYFFGRELHKELKTPVGLIDSCVGGTPAELWTGRKALEANPALKSLAGGASSKLYNGMIAPLVPYALRGAIWYQGESNASRAFMYRTLFPAMIANWRADWGQGDFPFGFVQLANFKATQKQPGNSEWAELREAQTLTLQSPNTGMAVIVDIGDAKDIHPTNKQDVGKRLALWALAKTYGKDLVYSGPLYQSMEKKGGQIVVRFDHVGSGLVARDGKPLEGFAIAGPDQKFVWAEASIVGDTVVVSSPAVPDPVAVRYAWADNPPCTLYNREGLPASPFRTDTWKGITEK